MKTIIRPITWLGGCVTGWGNGYILIPKGHRMHGVDYDDIPVDVHGGLTFAILVNAKTVKEWEGLGMDESDIGTWMVGFDTVHAYDTPISCPESYVINETENLKNQLESIK